MNDFTNFSISANQDFSGLWQGLGIMAGFAVLCGTCYFWWRFWDMMADVKRIADKLDPPPPQGYRDTPLELKRRIFK